jgi:hypothetical protein
VKVCIECRHYEGPQAQVYLGPMTVTQQPVCKHPDAVTRDMVTGRCLCTNERNFTKGCGKQGRLWEPLQNNQK